MDLTVKGTVLTIVNLLVPSAQLSYNNGVNKKCGRCGGGLRRVHRTFIERFSLMAKFRCKACQNIETAPRRYRYHLGNRCRCPRCGTFRITKLKERDKIDPMVGGFLNHVERLMGGRLYHCRFCRIQFFDRRHFIPAPMGAPAAQPPVANPSEQNDIGFEDQRATQQPSTATQGG